MQKKFTQADKDFVRANYGNMTAREIGKILGRSKISVQHIYERLDLPPKHRADRWTDEEQAILERDYPEFGPRVLAKRLGRSEAAVAHRAHRSGIHAIDDGQRMRMVQTINAKNEARYAVDGIKTRDAWKRFVLRRDNYTCTDCALIEPTIMVAHHIRPTFDHPQLQFDPCNGVTLCPNCHARRHVVLGRGDTRELSDRDKELIVELRTTGKTVLEICQDVGVNHKSVMKYLDTFARRHKRNKT